MSRGFVKEEDREERPIIMPRALIPEGVPNYVRPEGLAALKEEKASMEAALAAIPSDCDADHRLARDTLRCKIEQVNERLQTARVIDSPLRDAATIGFGALVRLVFDTDREPRQFLICGADEAAAAPGRLSFFSPLARALTGLQAGQKTIVRLPAGSRRVSIIGVSYPER